MEYENDCSDFAGYCKRCGRELSHNIDSGNTCIGCQEEFEVKGVVE